MKDSLKPFIRGRRSSSDLRPAAKPTQFFIDDVDLYNSSRAEISFGKPLMSCVVDDLIYGVQSRPSIPACWEDDSDEGVDPLTDITVSPWDLMAADCRRKPSLRGYEREPSQEDVQSPSPGSSPAPDAVSES